MNKLVITGSIILVILSSSCKKEEHDSFSTLFGVVSDFETGEPVSGASVILSPGSKTKTTEQDGKFEFNNLEPTQYTVTVQKSGYQTNRKTVTAVVGERIEVNVTLNKSN